MPKRKLDDISRVVDSIKLKENWMEELLKLEPNNLALVLGEVANRAKISNFALQKARQNVPSFSAAKWEDVALQFGLHPNPDFLDHNLPNAKTPMCRLPLSFHEKVLEGSWRSQDVYQEIVQQSREAARGRLFDTYLVPIIALFQGRFINMPEQPMPATEYSSGGEVENEIFVIGGALLLIAELKLNINPGEGLAQLFLELHSSADLNQRIRNGGLRIHGLLTDLITFKFYSYDPVTKAFHFDENITVSPTREGFLCGMVLVSNKIFSIALSTYIAAMKLLELRRRSTRSLRKAQNSTDTE